MAASVAIAVMAVPATGLGIGRHDSRVKLAVFDPFHGRVISEKPACEPTRTVRIFNKEPGVDGLFASTRTDNNGRWSVAASPHGDFYAVVTRQRKTSYWKTFVCRSDRSPVRHFN
jgi:hypothetical protein